MAEATGLRLYVEKSGKTHQQIADELGVARTTVTRWLSNNWRPLDDVYRLLLACGLTHETAVDVPIGDLFDFEVAQ